MSTGAGAGPVVVCYDGSDSSAAALAVAGRVLQARETVVCHAWTGLSRAIFRAGADVLPAALRHAAEELDELDREAAARVAAAGVRLARDAGVDARPRTVKAQGSTWRALAEAADEEGAAAIVAGAHGHSGLGRAVLGSVSTALLHHATRPVLVVPQPDPTHRAGGPVLLAYDGSDPAARSVEAASRLLRERNAVVVNVWQTWAGQVPVLVGPVPPLQGMTAELDEIAAALSARTAADGARLAAQLSFASEPRSARSAGSLWRGILDAATDVDAELIVIGSRGSTGLSRALGSVSNGVVHHSRRPVLVVPPRAG